MPSPLADQSEPSSCHSRQGSGELTLVPDLIDAETASVIVGVSRRTWYRYVENGDVPQPVRFGGSVKWRREEIDEWIRAGCPRVRKDDES